MRRKRGVTRCPPRRSFNLLPASRRARPDPRQLKAVAKVSGAENFVGNLCRNLCRIGHFSTLASTKFATKMENQHFRNKLQLDAGRATRQLESICSIVF